ncbi:hypothetical protein AMS68_004630 [Peltaster fructicola]|uniref:Gem-associated protein 5 TPR domain-containing protein n=1 Tax=Peltaster fructicola TaxID=286661 RepID=A0A6H0XWI7_9PEZI|nr:hypothetical protein AMS68_004630 [Peltaster fructicola]
MRGLNSPCRSISVRQRDPIPPNTTVLTPENAEQEFEPCAATGSFLLYAQRNTILVLHHDTLAIERRFELHREDVKWITVDTVSERGSGRLAVSYDTGNTAIVWDIFSGAEVARFSAYDTVNVACFMRNGNIAFGNVQGSIILFEPATSEHISARTIFDPITALAPATDCRTFAVGYLNGSILVATIHPAFTIQHTLTTSRTPSKITGLAWHGSSSKSKTDMLATQTADGDLRVWSVPKTPGPDQPMIIRILNRGDMPSRGPNWFAWSKNGRIVQYLDSETRAWDVRTKKVTFDVIPTIDGITSIANYGPTATLFTLGRGHTVQQYDINPNNSPMQVNNVQHVPANTPPTPPTNLEEHKNPYSTDFAGMAPIIPLTDNESSADEGAAMSPLEKIAREMESLDALESERRDKIMPLSPTVSSRASSTSSRSSGRGFRQRKYLYDRPESSRASTTSGYEGTEFSYGVTAPPRNHENMSIRSSASVASSKYRGSSLRHQILRSPQETEATANMDLFPNVRARLKEVDFRTPHYGNTARTADILRREMISIVFGWNDDVPSLIRDEISRQRPGAASAVLLAKWVGESNSMASMVGSESMTSSDWMLLALSSIEANSQKKVGEAFVQRLLEKGDIHPAVAILIGMGEYNDAIEVYVEQGLWMEALLLCALYSPSDWGRLSFLLRKWGAVAVTEGSPELAVRIFSCASVESTEPWTSPRAQDAAYASAQQKLSEPLSAGPLTSPPLSPPARSASGRLKAKNASLKLITTFGDRLAPVAAGDPTPLAHGVTPIAQTALSPGGDWQRRGPKRDNSEIRTATPGGYNRRKRLPSRSDIDRAKAEAAEMATPLTAAKDTRYRAPSASASRSRRTSSVSRLTEEPASAIRSRPNLLIADADQSRLPSPSEGAFTRFRESSRARGASRNRNPGQLAVQVVETKYDSETLSPSQETSTSDRDIVSPLHTSKAKAIDSYISSVEEARVAARQERAESRRRPSRSRNESRPRTASRARDQSESRRREPRTIKASKRSPSSPVPMSPDDFPPAVSAPPATDDDEDFYRIASPLEPSKDTRTFAQRQRPSDEAKLDDRGRHDKRGAGSAARSPSTPLAGSQEPDTESESRRLRTRAASNVDPQSRRGASRSRARSSSRRPGAESIDDTTEQDMVAPLKPRPRTKEQAARELEERRLSLARRPSAPAIPLPPELTRPIMTPRSNTELGNSPTSYMPPMSRSATVDPDAMARYGKITGTSTSSTPIGLPATPRAMRHPKYMTSNPEKDNTPPVPEIPDLASFSGSALSQATGSMLSTMSPSLVSDHSDSLDTLGPLLPSTVYKGPPSRSASAPPEKSMGGLPSHPAYKPSLSSARGPKGGHIRKISPPDASVITSPNAITSIDEALTDDQQIVIIPEPEASVVMLPELQHLAGPPAPPPPPTMFTQAVANHSGMINIAIDGNESNISSDLSSLSQAPSQFPQPMDRAMTTSPTSRHARSSTNESFTSRMRGVADRMRSSSRTGRVKSPVLTSLSPAPYETVLPHESMARTKSPYEQAMASQTDHGVIPPPPPAPAPPTAGYEHVLNETSIPPRLQNAAYRTPKEIRANMPPDYTQAGAQGGFL